MSLVISGTNIIIVLVVLIGFNLAFCIKPKPLLGVSIGIVSLVFLFGFSVNYIGINIIFMLILLAFTIINLAVSVDDFHRR